MQTKKYIPPAKQQQQQQQQNKQWQPVQKTNSHLKKQSELNMKYSSNDFPELNSKSKTQIERIPFSFADVTEKYKTNQQKKEEEEKEKENSINKLMPGWMYIRRNIDNKHKIEYKYGPESDHYTASLIQRKKDEKKQSDIYFRKLVELWQWDRDEQNRLLGDCSPYWGTATLMEMYDVDTADDKESYRKRWNQKTFVNESAALVESAALESAVLESAVLESASNNIEYDSIKYN
jgi:hypothetical protein